MMWHAMAQMGIWPAHTVVKVDDTLPGIGEGVAAGTWTVGVTLSGNMVGLSAEELAALSEAERNKLREQASCRHARRRRGHRHRLGGRSARRDRAD